MFTIHFSNFSPETSSVTNMTKKSGSTQNNKTKDINNNNPIEEKAVSVFSVEESLHCS